MITYTFDTNKDLAMNLEKTSKSVEDSLCQILRLYIKDSTMIFEISGFIWDKENLEAKADNELQFSLLEKLAKEGILPSSVSTDFRDYLNTKIIELKNKVEFYNKATLNCLDCDRQDKLNDLYNLNKTILNKIYNLNKVK